MSAVLDGPDKNTPNFALLNSMAHSSARWSTVKGGYHRDLNLAGESVKASTFKGAHHAEPKLMYKLTVESVQSIEHQGLR